MQEFKTINFAGLASVAGTQSRWLLEDFIPERSIGVLVGEWGIGKSPFALQLQLSLAAGLPFLGRYKPGKENISCLYVDLENGAQPVVSILRSLAAHLGLAEPPVRWNVYSPNYVGKGKGLEHIQEDSYIKALIKANPFDFIIIDPLRMFKPDAESKNSMAAEMIKGIRDLISVAGSTIMFIHHPRKPAADISIQRYKLDSNPTEWMANACGAGALIQNADFRIGLEENEDGYIVCRRFLRNRGWSPAEYIDRTYDDATEEPIGYTLKLGVERLTALERQWLMDLGKIFTTKELLFVSQKTRRTCNDLLKKWVSLLVIQKVDRGAWAKI